MSSGMEKVRGTRDFPPKDWRVMNFVFDNWRRVCERYGFEEYESPILDYYETYAKKSGDELASQVYNFPDKAGRRLALRPEMTPMLSRIYEENEKSITKPAKWYSIPRCFRYEQPQKGRFREFFQLNVDVLDGGVEAGGEVIACSIDVLREFGLKERDFKVVISNRKLFEGLSKQVTDKNVMPIVDRFKKVSKADFLKLLKKEGLDAKQASRIYDIASVNGKAEKTLMRVKDLCENNESLQGWQELSSTVKTLAAYGLLDYCELDLSIVRGLAYYTGLVFECFDRKGKLRSLFGGGAYRVGGSDAVGFGFGDAVLLELLGENKLVPELSVEIDFFVATVGDSVRDKSKAVISALRSKGYNVDFDLMGRSLKKQLDYARKLGAPRVVIIGERELAEDRVVLKEFSSGEEKTIPISELLA